MRGNVLAVVGAQYGSEGKGAIASHLANQYNVHVRVGGPNAGHTIFYMGRKFKMQIIPCGWTNPSAFLVIGRGAIVNMDLLMQEIKMLEEFFPTIKYRVIIDKYAGVLDSKFAEEEGHTNGELHQRIGSTGEGVGAARVARIGRDRSRFKRICDVAEDYGISRMAWDTVEFLNWANHKGMDILLEGTQGCGLSLIHGPWPYVTSADTNASQLAADVGLSPRVINQILLVARTFPIRVAGNSGPLYDEISWDEISRRMGRPVEERTTVTNKVRRIGSWDPKLMRLATTINQPTSIALTFMDYLCPQDQDMTSEEGLSNYSKKFIQYVEEEYGRVSLVKTGEANESIIVRGEV